MVIDRNSSFSDPTWQCFSNKELATYCFGVTAWSAVLVVRILPNVAEIVVLFAKQSVLVFYIAAKELSANVLRHEYWSNEFLVYGSLFWHCGPWHLTHIVKLKHGRGHLRRHPECTAVLGIKVFPHRPPCKLSIVRTLNINREMWKRTKVHSNLPQRNAPAVNPIFQVGEKYVRTSTPCRVRQACCHPMEQEA